MLGGDAAQRLLVEATSLEVIAVATQRAPRWQREHVRQLVVRGRVGARPEEQRPSDHLRKKAAQLQATHHTECEFTVVRVSLQWSG